MEYLNMILSGAGFVITAIASIVLLIKFAKASKIGFIFPLLLIIGIVSLVSGLLIPIKSDTNAVTANSAHSSPTTTTNQAQVTPSTKTNQIKITPFDPNGSVVPKESTDVYGNQTIIDADGSKAYNYLLFTPEGIRYLIKPGDLVPEVYIPDGKSDANGKHYKSYDYSSNIMDGTVTVVESNLAIAGDTSNSKVHRFRGRWHI